MFHSWNMTEMTENVRTASFGVRLNEAKEGRGGRKERKKRNLKVSFIIIRTVLEVELSWKSLQPDHYPSKSRNLCIWNIA